VVEIRYGQYTINIQRELEKRWNVSHSNWLPPVQKMSRQALWNMYTHLQLSFFYHSCCKCPVMANGNDDSDDVLWFLTRGDADWSLSRWWRCNPSTSQLQQRPSATAWTLILNHVCFQRCTSGWNTFQMRILILSNKRGWQLTDIIAVHCVGFKCSPKYTTKHCYAQMLQCMALLLLYIIQYCFSIVHYCL